jgi:hypothetical protein
MRDTIMMSALPCAVDHYRGTTADGHIVETAALPDGSQEAASSCDVIAHVVGSREIGQSVQNLRARCARF